MGRLMNELIKYMTTEITKHEPPSLQGSTWELGITFNGYEMEVDEEGEKSIASYIYNLSFCFLVFLFLSFFYSFISLFFHSCV